IRSLSSTVSPDHDSAMMTSSGVIMPRSPWLASLGCTKKAGVPVEASVAAILRPTCPDLPIPVTITRPRARETSSTASMKARPRPSWMACESVVMPLAASSSVRTAEATRSPSRAFVALSVVSGLGIYERSRCGPGQAPGSRAMLLPEHGRTQRLPAAPVDEPGHSTARGRTRHGVRLTDRLPYFDAAIRTGARFKLRYFECGVPRYGNSLRVSVWGLRPVGGHSPFVRNARR